LGPQKRLGPALDETHLRQIGAGGLCRQTETHRKTRLRELVSGKK